MIDHLIRYRTEEEANAAITFYGASISYRTDVILVDAEWSDNKEPKLLEPEILASGYHVWITLHEISEELRTLPDDSCRLIADRSLITEDCTFEDVLLYHAEDITTDVLVAARISPVPAGTNYPFRKMP